MFKFNIGFYVLIKYSIDKLSQNEEDVDNPKPSNFNYFEKWEIAYPWAFCEYKFDKK